MPWNPLTEADITLELLPAEVAVINAVQGAGVVLTALMVNVVDNLQAAILAGGNQIDQPGNVPDQIRDDAIAIIRWRWLCSLPKTSLQTDGRKTAWEEALKHVALIRSGKEKTEIPANPQNVAGPSFRVSTVRRGQEVDRRGIDVMGGT